jgi:hypothetical protein
MVVCPVCGRTYGVTHSCPGPAETPAVLPRKWQPPTGFAVTYYFRHAVAVARLDDDAIIAASLDAKAVLYGAIIWLIGQLLGIVPRLWTAATRGGTVQWPVLLFGFLFLVLLGAVWVLAQFGLVHLLARLLFGARGTYVCVLRPLLLGSIVTWLVVVPYVGTAVAALWSVAVMMVVFEEVDKIERLQAFGLSVVIGLAFWAVMFLALASR